MREVRYEPDPEKVRKLWEEGKTHRSAGVLAGCRDGILPPQVQARML